MAYDIYGHPLQRGHCEVHPNHRGEYPCDLCEEEYYEYEQDRAMQEEYEDSLIREFWAAHFDDEGRHPMEDVAGGD